MSDKVEESYRLGDVVIWTTMPRDFVPYINKDASDMDWVATNKADILKRTRQQKKLGKAPLPQAFKFAPVRVPGGLSLGGGSSGSSSGGGGDGEDVMDRGECGESAGIHENSEYAGEAAEAAALLVEIEARGKGYVPGGPPPRAAPKKKRESKAVSQDREADELNVTGNRSLLSLGATATTTGSGKKGKGPLVRSAVVTAFDHINSGMADPSKRDKISALIVSHGHDPSTLHSVIREMLRIKVPRDGVIEYLRSQLPGVPDEKLGVIADDLADIISQPRDRELGADNVTPEQALCGAVHAVLDARAAAAAASGSQPKKERKKRVPKEKKERKAAKPKTKRKSKLKSLVSDDEEVEDGESKEEKAAPVAAADDEEEEESIEPAVEKPKKKRKKHVAFEGDEPEEDEEKAELTEEEMQAARVRRKAAKAARKAGRDAKRAKKDEKAAAKTALAGAAQFVRVIEDICHSATAADDEEEIVIGDDDN